MNIKLLEYLKRYEFSPNKYSNFFSNLDTSDLPYLIETEFFNIRLKKALENNEKICIYSDYDADAITATATMYWGLIFLGFNKNNISFYAPDRFTEGYGINSTAIKNIAQQYDLIISVDCGINSVLEAKICLELKTDLIITDHHVLSGSVPSALAVINPRLHEEYQKNFLARRTRESAFEQFFPTQQFKVTLSKDEVSPSVCGVGVAWFCLLHLAHYLQLNPAKLNLLLPFVAIGTIADCQSIRDNQNRLLVKAGLKIFPQALSTFIGLRELVIKAGLYDKVSNSLLSSQDLGYLIAPMLNAAGRIDHANIAIELLCSQNIVQAEELSLRIKEINTNRKELVKDAFESTSLYDFTNKPLVFMVTDYSKGIIGLIASKMVEKYQKVTVIISQDPKGNSSASLRAPKGYNLVEIMKNIKPSLLDKFGGHPEAAGFSCPNEKCEDIELEFERILNIYKPESHNAINYLNEEDIDPQFNQRNIIYINQNDLSHELFEDVYKLEPFGQDFPIPNFLLKIDNYSIVVIGKLQNHFKVHFKNFSFLIFNPSDSDKNLLLNQKPILILFKVNKNIFNSTITNQFIIDKVKEILC